MIMFDSDLLGDLRKWKAAGEELVLMGDYNQNIMLYVDDTDLLFQAKFLYDSVNKII